MATRKISKKVVEEQIETPVSPTRQEQPKNLGKIIFAIAALAILGFVLYQNRSLFVVALVDNKPIWRPAFEQRVLSQVGQKTLDEMINEQVIMNEAAKKGISVSAADVDAKISDIQKTLPKGTTLDSALSSQGMSLADLRRQLSLQLTIEKLLGNQIQVTDQEIAKFIEENKSFLTATDEASLKVEATQALQSQKRNTEFQKLFSSLQKNAKVTKFL